MFKLKIICDAPSNMKRAYEYRVRSIALLPDNVNRRRGVFFGYLQAQYPALLLRNKGVTFGKEGIRDSKNERNKHKYQNLGS